MHATGNLLAPRIVGGAETCATLGGKRPPSPILEQIIDCRNVNRQSGPQRRRSDARASEGIARSTASLLVRFRFLRHRVLLQQRAVQRSKDEGQWQRAERLNGDAEVGRLRAPD